MADLCGQMGDIREALVAEIQRLQQTIDSADRFDDLYDGFIYQIEHLHRRILEFPDFDGAALLLIRACDMMKNYVRHRERDGPLVTTPVIVTGNPGRRRFDIDRSQLNFLIGNGYTVKEVATFFGVSERTIKYRLTEFGLSCRMKFSKITDEHLETKILFCLQSFPNAGYKAVEGFLKSEGIQVQRDRLRETMLRVDPEGRQINAIRRRIRRRVYNVPSPMALWHIDGNHKLIRWRLVVHGGIDGFSRLIVYLQCGTNNLSQTVLDLFQEAVSKWGLPARVRGDKGVENRDVAHYMLSHPLRGPGQRAFISGRSVHNTRIERLWRDVFETVLGQFQEVFFDLEETGHLSPDSELALAALHYVYLPRINKKLHLFVNMWNNHKIRTANSKTPMELFVRGMNMVAGEEGVVPDEYFGGLEHYGFDPDAPASLEDEQGVVVPAPDPNAANLDVLRNLDLPTEDEDKWGIESYKQVLGVLVSESE